MQKELDKVQAKAKRDADTMRENARMEREAWDAKERERVAAEKKQYEDLAADKAKELKAAREAADAELEKARDIAAKQRHQAEAERAARKQAERELQIAKDRAAEELCTIQNETADANLKMQH